MTRVRTIGLNRDLSPSKEKLWDRYTLCVKSVPPKYTNQRISGHLASFRNGKLLSLNYKASITEFLEEGDCYSVCYVQERKATFLSFSTR